MEQPSTHQYFTTVACAVSPQQVRERAMDGSEANQGLVLPKMAEVSEEYVSFLGYSLTSYSFVVWTF